MNIFATSPDPYASAAALDDKRVIKMIVESAQLLSTTVRRYGITQDETIYRTSHENHPCALWVAKSRANYVWLMSHAYGLSSIYTNVYIREHATQRVLNILWNYRNLLPDLGLTPFPNCTIYKGVPDTHLAYRLALQTKWASDARIPTWQGRERPSWA